jgi:hypothetical protein
MTTTTAKLKGVLLKITGVIRHRIDIANLVLLVLLMILALLSFNRGWFGGSGGHNFEIFISAAITGLVAALAIIIPLRIQKKAATRTLAMVVSSELYRNLSEMEYADQELKKDYNKQPPAAGSADPKGQQSMEMGKVIGVAARLDAALEKTGYNGMMSSRIIADIDQSVAQAIIEAYSGIASAQKTARHFADLFNGQFNAEATGVNPAVTEYSRQHYTNKGIDMVKEDVCIAIGQINTAIDALNGEMKQHGQKFKPVYRDALVEKYGSGKEKKKGSDQSSNLAQ